MPTPHSPERVPSGTPTPMLDARLAAVARRARVQRALEATPPLVAGLGAGLACVALAHDLHVIRGSEALVAALIATSASALVVAIVALRPLDTLGLAVAIDRALSLRGRLGNALALASDPSPMAALARRDAEQHARALEPARVLPLRLRRLWLVSLVPLALALVLLGIGPFERTASRRETTEGPQTLHVVEAPAEIDPDTLEAMRERMADAQPRAALSPELAEATDALNALIEAVAAGELTQSEALARLSELEASLDLGAAARAAELQRTLADAAQQMREARSTEALARALTEGHLEEAARELRAMAERARTQAPPRELIENLRALAQDREQRARERSIAEAEEETERLLQQRRERQAQGQDDSPEEERLLEQRQRELDRLRREHEARSEVERQLDELRRELDESAERMEQERRGGEAPQEPSSESMERAAEQMRRHARDQQTAEQMQSLARELERLREALREAQQQREQGRQGGGNSEQPQGEQGEGGQGARMRRFVLRAGGGDEGGEGMRLGTRRPGGQAGEGGEESGEQHAGPRGQQQGQGEQGEGAGQEGQGGTEGSGQPGQGEGGEGGEMLVVGEGGDAVLEIPGMGQPGGRGEPGRGEGRDEGPGRGSGHDPRALEEASARLGGGRSVQVSGQPGTGASRSQVIRGASAQGFASRDYERVYEDYASHAEEAVERDRVPPGRRSHVQRYFELIRPRTSSSEGP